MLFHLLLLIIIAAHGDDEYLGSGEDVIWKVCVC